MENQLLKSRLLQLVTVLVAFGFCSIAQAQVKNYPVQIQVNSTETELLVEERGICNSNNHNGCIEVPPKKKARIKFTMGAKNCKQPDGEKWEIGEVYLGGKNSSSKPGPSDWGNLDSEVEADFNVADVVTGRLNKESGSNKNSTVIFDENLADYDIWYKVTAVCVDRNGKALKKLETDPRIKNGGTF